MRGPDGAVDDPFMTSQGVEALETLWIPLQKTQVTFYEDGLVKESSSFIVLHIFQSAQMNLIKFNKEGKKDQLEVRYDLAKAHQGSNKGSFACQMLDCIESQEHYDNRYFLCSLLLGMSKTTMFFMTRSVDCYILNNQIEHIAPLK